MGKIQPLFGSCDADVSKSPFLLYLFGDIHTLLTGEDALFHARNEHNGEFESLCRMKRHEHNGIRLRVIVINIGHERDLFQKARKGCILVFGLIRHKVRDKLGDVFDSLTSLFLVRFKVLNIIGFIENLFEQLLNRNFVHKSVQLLNHSGKLEKLTA